MKNMTKVNEVIAKELLENLEKDFPNVEFSLIPAIKVNDNNSVALKIDTREDTKLIPCLNLGPAENLADFTVPDQYINLCSKIKKVIENSENVSMEDLGSGLSFDYESISHKIIPQIVSKTLNEKLLKTVPNTEVCEDLSCIYRLVLKTEPCLGTTIITNEHLAKLGVDLEELHNQAFLNLEKEELCITPLSSMNPVFRADFNLTVINNGMPKSFGATCLFRKGVIEALTRKMGGEDEFYLIPSSTDEWLAMSTKGMSLDEIAHKANLMIKEVNETLEPGMVLSNHIYVIRDGKLVSTAA